MKDLNELSKRIYDQNKAVGWWDDQNRCIFTTIQLINTEIAEATEGERKGLMDDHLQHRKMGEVELADALIRTLDLAGRMGVVFDDDMDERIAEAQKSTMLNRNIFTAHLMLSCVVCRLMDYINLKSHYDLNMRLRSGIKGLAIGILAVGSLYGYDVMAALEEKLKYNKTRADHKRENRAKEGGKKV